MANRFEIRSLFCAALTGLLACGNTSNEDPDKIAAQALRQAEASGKLLAEKYPYLMPADQGACSDAQGVSAIEPTPAEQPPTDPPAAEAPADPPPAPAE
jgi:hypothetical protein